MLIGFFSHEYDEMTVYRQTAIFLLWFVSFLVCANKPVGQLSDYIRQTYGQRLILEPSQLEQLAWVLDNSYVTPEMSTYHEASSTHKIPIEACRALARVYCLRF
ncbi:hypothetical protein CI610_02022 [invertebrate metagenome]|uniref:Uncharacterized protein n=1 Tax=invertebrate metagenome TaxID=1711999 RepID=A0A2H9T707_9ZZZZ